MSAETTSVRLVDCAKTFPDGTQALERMSITVAGGETVVLLGPSGCGKTTMLRIIAGLEAPDPGGTVLFNDEDVTATPIEKRNVGMVFQSYALFPNMSVRDNVAYGLKVRGHDKVQTAARVAEMLDMMDIAPLASRRIDQLSGGQRQRVALARAIAVRPRVLLLDEPLTALDALLRDRLRIEIDALLRSLAITAIYVTHDQAEALALGDRVFVMDHGRIAQAGTPKEIYHAPANDFVADFVGTVNRMPGRIDGATVAVDGAVLPHQDACGAEGSAVEVMFRPEDIEVVAPSEAQFSGRVEASFFLGSRTRLILTALKDRTIIVDSSSRDTFRIGDQVQLRVRPEGVKVLTPGEGG
ncbi:MAG: ABC transporter ATP-binding protein [Hyphomicrobiales bacterium]